MVVQASLSIEIFLESKLENAHFFSENWKLQNKVVHTTLEGTITM